MISYEWKGDIKKIIKTIEKNLDKIRVSLPFDIWFTLKISLAIAYTQIDLKKAKEIARECYLKLKRKKYKSPYFLFDLATFYMHASEYKRAEKLLNNAIEKVDKDREIFIEKLSIIHFVRGNFQESVNLIKKSRLPKWACVSKLLRYLSAKYLFKGEFQKSYEYLKKALEISKIEDSYDIWMCTFLLSIYYSLIGELKEAKRILREISPFLLKRGLFGEKNICDIVLNKKNVKIKKNFSPFLKIINLLKERRYYKEY